MKDSFHFDKVNQFGFFLSKSNEAVMPIPQFRNIWVRWLKFLSDYLIIYHNLGYCTWSLHVQYHVDQMNPLSRICKIVHQIHRATLKICVDPYYMPMYADVYMGFCSSQSSNTS